MSEELKLCTKGMSIDDIPKRTHLGFKIACFLDGRSMRKVLIDYMYSFAETNEVWDIVDKQLDVEEQKRKLGEVEENIKQEIREQFNGGE